MEAFLITQHLMIMRINIIFNIYNLGLNFSYNFGIIFIAYP